LINPIYIPSKKRPGGKTFSMIFDLNCEKHLILEKEDVSSYMETKNFTGYNIHMLAESNKGIAYARKAIKELAEDNGHEWYWSIDDDINSFHKCQSNGRLDKICMEQALLDAQDLIKKLNVAQGALNYSQFAFGNGKPYSFNKRCLIATLNHVGRLRRFDYDLNCTLKEDVDFTMQILTGAQKTVLCNKIAFNVPVYGSLNGGCYELYQQKRIEKTMSEYLEKKWGKNLIRKIIKKNGRYDVKINWNYFK
jgi:hypothetical protein